MALFRTTSVSDIRAPNHSTTLRFFRKTLSRLNFLVFKCARKTRTLLSELISFNQILEHHDNISPPIKLPHFPEIVSENQIKHNFNNIVKSTDNQNQANYTIYESQYEVLMSQTRIKKRETSMEMDQSKRIEETSKTPVKLAGPCFLNMIDPFQINRRHMKLLTHRLNNNEFEDLKDRVRSISHVG